jgi:hypothetical protein
MGKTNRPAANLSGRPTGFSGNLDGVVPAANAVADHCDAQD